MANQLLNPNAGMLTTGKSRDYSDSETQDYFETRTRNTNNEYYPVRNP